MIFEKIVKQSLFQKYLLDPSKIFDLPDFIEWIKTFRWIPKKTAQKGKKYNYSIEKFFEDIENDIHFLYNLLIIDSGESKEEKMYFFLPFLCSDQEISSDLLRKLKSSFNIKTKIESSKELYIYPAEYHQTFWKNMFNQTSKNKKFHLLISKDDENFLTALRSKTFRINVLGGGDTTNIVLSFQIPDQEPILCKIYKNISLNLEIPVLNHLLKANFDHIPRIFGSIGIFTNGTNENRSVNVLFREFLESQNDAGSIFWDELNNFFSSDKADIIINSTNYTQKMFKKLFPKSSSYAVKIGAIMHEMHKDLRLSNQSLNEIGSNNNPNVQGPLSNFFIEDEFTESDLLELRNLLIDIMQNIYSQTNSQSKPNSKEFNDNVINSSKSIREFIKNLIPKNLIHSPYLNKQPIHQDLHFSQMIQIEDLKRDPVFIDFEGDPLLPESFKFKKYPYFQDIASTLRAFSYIKFNTLITPIGKIFKLNQDLNKSSKNATFQCLIASYLFSILKKQMNSDVFLIFIKNLLVDFSNILNINYQTIHKFMENIREVEEVRRLLIFSKFWEKFMSERILYGYFNEDGLLQSDLKIRNKNKSEEQIIKILQLFLYRRALFELKYERTFRPLNQIVPILGLIDLFLSI